jgi:predicted PurR-regulated permease PerM
MPLSVLSRRLLAVLVAVATVWFLIESRPVTMPLAFALFFAVLFEPVRRRLADVMPQAAAVGLTFLLAVAVLALFGWAVYAAADQAVTGLQDYGDEFERLRGRVQAFLADAGLGGSAGGGAADGAIRGVARTLVGDVWSVLGYTVLVYALLALALSEVPAWGHKLRTRFDHPIPGDVLDTTGRIAGQVRRFVVVQAFTSVLTGVLTGLFCWLVGVDLAFTWGLLAGVLNFVPTVGSIAAVVPPTAFALFQFGLGWEPAVVLLGLAAIQLVLGAYVDPKLQGRYLELSAFVVLVAITFWAWVWGIPGAFIAVPLTAAVVVAFGEFEGTRWLHRLLTRDRPPGETEPA